MLWETTSGSTCDGVGPGPLGRGITAPRLRQGMEESWFQRGLFVYKSTRCHKLSTEFPCLRPCGMDIYMYSYIYIDILYIYYIIYIYHTILYTQYHMINIYIYEYIYVHAYIYILYIYILYIYILYIYIYLYIKDLVHFKRMRQKLNLRTKAWYADYNQRSEWLC